MDTAKRIAKNTTVFFAANVLGYIMAFFTNVYTARYLGADEFGALSIALSFSVMFNVFADLGFSTFTTRELAKEKSLRNKYVENTWILRSILAIITIGVIALITNLSGYLGKYNSETIKIIYILSLTIIIGVFPSIFTSVFQAYEKMEYPSLSTMLNGVLFLVGTLFLIFYGFNVLAFALLNVVVALVIFIYSILIYTKKFSLPKMQVDLGFWKQSMKEALPFGLTNISGMIYTYIDSLLLSVMQSSAVVGWYTAAYKLVLVLYFIPNAVNMAIFPVMSKYYISSKDSLKLIYEKYFKLMIIMGLPIAFGTTLLADKIVLIIYGTEYINSIVALQILIWTVVFTFAESSFVQLLQATNKQMIITKISVICVIINIILNVILIPRFSYIGASVATVLTEIILVSYVIAVTYKIGFGINPYHILKDIFKVLTASIIMSLFIWYFKNVELIILIIIATITYLITLYLLKGIDKEDLDLLKQIIKR